MVVGNVENKTPPHNILIIIIYILIIIVSKSIVNISHWYINLNSDFEQARKLL